MKQIFAVFCAIVLLPTFTTHAWVGGPFSNNGYFGESGDDGIYEAVGVTKNGIGIFRWAVANNVTGIDSGDITNFTINFAGGTRIDIVPVSSNAESGGLGVYTHTWFINGVAYWGRCRGSANSGINRVYCVGEGVDSFFAGASSSSFLARFERFGDGLPVSRFSGKGRVSVSDVNANVIFESNFRAFGSKGTSDVIVGGVGSGG